MRRAPIVIIGTIAGLVGVLEFHTTPSTLSASSLQTGPPAAAKAGASSAAGGSGHSAAARSSGGRSRKQTAGTATPSGTRSAVGPGVNYNYGVLAVKVTVSGTKIVKVGIASLNDGGNPQSQFIDQQAIPILEQEVMQAQSANIQSVSGASYTSAGFDQSLQSALHKAGFA